MARPNGRIRRRRVALIAPDLRGFGSSFAPAANDAYTIEEIVADMAELHDNLGRKAAIWVGHDWAAS
ncbi:alpha/beta fold hydrolase [Rhizobium sp. CNPSo 4062]|uniref:alpha/beta fold hydrolase n=1 Tax=Rhizobium sp. CNPSo 4062 TaxID=3021410 RepID=UPI00254A6A40|nr:alpha/beta fold hydrolase [Rhizobium sp. CNPSo 4062]MDK4705921.1 alpha/beta fold hydrolase [Rhizobium sp. CNPSo 4062]